MLKPLVVIMLLAAQPAMAANMINIEVHSELERAQFIYLFDQDAPSPLLDFTLPAPDARLGKISKMSYLIDPNIKKDIGQITLPSDGKYYAYSIQLGAKFNVQPNFSVPDPSTLRTMYIGFVHYDADSWSAEPYHTTYITKYYKTEEYLYHPSTPFPDYLYGANVKGELLTNTAAWCYDQGQCDPPSINTMKGNKLVIAEVTLGYKYEFDADEQGLLDEVKRLDLNKLSKTTQQAVGYKELIAHLKGECSLVDAVARIVGPSLLVLRAG
nr:hypothetical protein [Thiobacillaceae bacterium]